MIKKAIEEMKCPTHGSHPIVEQTNEGLSIHTCCDEFKQAVIENYEQLKKEELRQALLNAFNA